MLSPKSLAMEWLTDDSAREHTITYEIVEDAEPLFSAENLKDLYDRAPSSPPPPAPPNRRPPAKAPEFAHYQTIGALHLRAGAAPDADDVLGYLIPQDLEVLGPRNEGYLLWQGSRRGAKTQIIGGVPSIMASKRAGLMLSI